MIAKKYIIAAALVGAVVLLERRARAGTLKCGPGYRLVPMTLAEAQAKWGSFKSWPQIAEQVRTYGGTCVATGTVTDAGTRPLDEDGGLDSTGSDMEDPVLITHPWQLP